MLVGESRVKGSEHTEGVEEGRLAERVSRGEKVEKTRRRERYLKGIGLK